MVFYKNLEKKNVGEEKNESPSTDVSNLLGGKKSSKIPQNPRKI